MKKTLDHLPKKYQKELQTITQKIKAFPWVEMVVLFWSFARWDYVEKDINYVQDHFEEFQSDYDIMVVVKNKFAEDDLDTYSLEKEVNESLWKPESWRYKRPVKIIFENIQELNEKLREDWYFYADVRKDGIILYDSWKYTLEKAKVFTPEEKLQAQKENFKHWFNSANVFLKHFTNAKNDNELNESAFFLHQSAERYMTTYLLVKNHYKPKEHDIVFLYNDVVALDWDFHWWFDHDNEYEESMLILLRRSYVDARYDKSFSISKQELEFLEKKVLWLRDLVEEKCEEVISLLNF